MARLLGLLGILAAAVSVSCSGIDSIRVLGPQAVNLWRLEQRNAARRAAEHLSVSYDSSSQTVFGSDSDEPSDLEREFPARWFEQPLDHFAKESETWNQRYWINTRYYKPNTSAPVIVLDGGETSGIGRLPFLDTGIVEILARATGGVGVILEHRYYGKSLPVQNLTTDSLRFLNNAQSAADSANFMAKVQFPGIDEDLTAPSHPWIYYGGSYAGARAAHMKILYPDLVYGAIASSGVTHASVENWEYMEIIRLAMDPRCKRALETAIGAVDELLKVRPLRVPLKALFGLAELEHDEDFVSVLESPLGSWQAKVWDPAVGSKRFDEFCEALTKTVIGRGPKSEHNRAVAAAGFPRGFRVAEVVYNYAQYIKKNYVASCYGGDTIEDCFGTFNDTKFQETGLDQEWRLWLFQVCTEWGYFSTAPPDGHPRIVSRLLTLPYESKICQQAYLPGEHFVVPQLPNITAVNSLGDFDIFADRLAIIDGEVDPWRPVTPHSDYAEDREDTILRPFKIIPNGVHHYDEYGLRDIADEPQEIQKIHHEMIDFVKAWLTDWKAEREADL